MDCDDDDDENDDGDEEEDKHHTGLLLLLLAAADNCGLSGSSIGSRRVAFHSDGIVQQREPPRLLPLMEDRLRVETIRCHHGDVADGTFPIFIVAFFLAFLVDPYHTPAHP